MSLRRRQLLAGAVVAACGTTVRADAWPNRPIKFIVPFPPGSTPDLIGRWIAEPLGQALGQPVVIDNRPGAGGNLGTGAAAQSQPDGYTFVLTIQGPLVTAPLLVKRLSYDPLKDLAPVSVVATSPNVLAVEPHLGARSVADFVRIARQRPGALNYGSVGIGSAAHLAMELFKTRAGLDIVHVPYAGFPQVVNAMLSGLVHAAFMVPGTAMPQARAGKLAALAVTTPGRVASLADLPTMAESGYPGFEAISWQAVLAPAGTPRPVVERMSAELVRIVKGAEMRSRMASQYFSAVGTAPEGLALLMRSERERWSRVIQAAGVRPE